jgi:ubiquinone/menaquinone biosynthesis C-methylase UbiE
VRFGIWIKLTLRAGLWIKHSNCAVIQSTAGPFYLANNLATHESAHPRGCAAAGTLLGRAPLAITNMTQHIQCPPTAAPTPDFTAIKTRQQATWGSGDYSAVAISVQIVAEQLCEAVDLRAGARVLDVATGSGNVALAAARRNTEVIGVDYVPSLLARGRERAAAEHVKVDFRDGDCEALPFKDAEFDYVLSTFGVMFAPDQVRSANELARVCKPGGKIGLSNWTPEGLIGQLFSIVGRYVPSPAGLTSPLAWGTERQLHQLFGNNAASIRTQRHMCVFRYRSVEHWLEVFRNYYGPVHKAFGALQPAQQTELARELIAVMKRHNRSGDATLAVPSEYLEIVITRA